MQNVHGCLNGTNISRDQVYGEVKKLVAESVGVNIEILQENTRLDADLNFDSLERVELAMEIEEHFDITVSDEMEQEIQTIGDIVDGVMKVFSKSPT
jgi:acyl carrier protein